jgi:hypothetical protein
MKPSSDIARFTTTLPYPALGSLIPFLRSSLVPETLRAFAPLGKPGPAPLDEIGTLSAVQDPARAGDLVDVAG